MQPFGGHSWTSITTQAEPGLFLDVGQTTISVRCLTLASWAAAMRAQAVGADIQHVTHPLGAKGVTVFFDEPEAHGFWPAKNCVAF